MKRITCFFLAAFLSLTMLCGCSLDITPRSLEQSMEIPDDGIIAAKVLEELKKDNGVITFCGQSGDVIYEWTVFGSDIETPKDTNLKLEVTENMESRLAFRLCTEEDFSFAPVLSLHATQLWNADSAVVYRGNGETQDAICSASVTGSKTSVLNFTLSQAGSFTVVAEETVQADPSVPVTAEKISQSEGRKSATTENTSQAEKATTESTSQTEKATTGTTEKETQTADAPKKTTEVDPYLTESKSGGGRVLSDGKQTGQDQYLTDPVPQGKPMPVEPEDQTIDQGRSYTCTFSIECATILNNLDDLNTDKLDAVPSNGVILPKTTVTFYEGESVYDVLQRVCRENNIHMEASWTPIYNSAYVEGIHNLYEFDCGTGSGWMYRVNGWYPNYGCSRYQLAQGDNVEWRYTCDLGADIGGGYAVNP